MSSALIRLLSAATAAYSAIALSTELLARLTIARFWEPWVRWIAPISALPVVLIALISGLVFGLVLGLVFRTYPTRVAGYAGILAVIFMLLGVVDLEWLASSVALLIGFVIGSATTDRNIRKWSPARRSTP